MEQWQVWDGVFGLILSVGIVYLFYKIFKIDLVEVVFSRVGIFIVSGLILFCLLSYYNKERYLNSKIIDNRTNGDRIILADKNMGEILSKSEHQNKIWISDGNETGWAPNKSRFPHETGSHTKNNPVNSNPETIEFESKNWISSLNKLVTGSMALDIEDTMNIGESYTATVVLSKSKDTLVLMKGLAAERFSVPETIEVSSLLKVELIDPQKDHFQITPLSSLEQVVDENSNTIWKWAISPTKAGNNSVVLRVTAKLANDLNDNYKDINVMERRIEVKSSAIFALGNFVSSYWQFLLTVGFIPLIGWAYSNFKGKGTTTKPKISGFGKK